MPSSVSPLKSLKKAGKLGIATTSSSCFACSRPVLFRKKSSFSSYDDEKDENQPPPSMVQSEKREDEPQKPNKKKKEEVVVKKRVRFARASNEDGGGTKASSRRVKVDIIGDLLVPSSEMTEEEINTLWLEQREFDYFEGTARMISNEIRRRDDSNKCKNGTTYGQVLTRAFASCCVAAESNNNGISSTALALEGRDESCVSSALRDGNETWNPLSDVEKAHLLYWVRVGHCRRGLERWSVTDMSKSRQARKDKALAIVLEVQRLAKDMGMKRELLAETIRMVSEGYTRPARMFALAMGEADAAAALHFFHETERVDSPSVVLPPTPKHSVQKIFPTKRNASERLHNPMSPAATAA